MDWSKRKGTTGKTEPSEQFLLEENILNIDQTTLSYVSLGKYTFNPKGAKTVK